MARRAGERVPVVLACGHSEQALREQLEAKRAYCRLCKCSRDIRRTPGAKCSRCGTPLNSYNLGPQCGPCDVAVAREAGAARREVA